MAVDRDRFKDLLKEKGFKMTRQRLVVLEVLAENPEQHLTAEEIYERVKVENPDIGLATVYRTVQLLLELELIDRINLDDGFIRYEIGSIEEKEHHRYHHLICMRCGKVSAFQDDMLEALESGVRDFTVEFLIIVFISALFSTEMFSSKIILFVQDICRRLFIRKF